MRASLPLAFAMAIGSPVSAQTPVADDTLPAVNRAIVEFVNEHMGRKVDRGECWDLAAGALNSAGAQWDGAYGFGRLLDWRKDTILPGDILQFERVTTERRRGNEIERLTFGKHTAVVMAVHERGSFTIGHQNFGPSGRKVSRLDFNMADVRGGKVTFYRPIR
jgi:hypothetical protein